MSSVWPYAGHAQSTYFYSTEILAYVTLQYTIWYTMNHLQMYVVAHKPNHIDLQVHKWIKRMSMMFTASDPIFCVRILGTCSKLVATCDILLGGGRSK